MEKTAGNSCRSGMASQMRQAIGRIDDHRATQREEERGGGGESRRRGRGRGPGGGQAGLHRNTQETSDDSLPFNPANRLLTREDAAAIFAGVGLEAPELTDGDMAALQNAFVHKSYVLPENTSAEDGNARRPADVEVPLMAWSYDQAEFHGDKVVGHATSMYIARRYAESRWARREGNLTRLVSSVVCGKSLADISRSMGLGAHIVISRQREAKGDRASQAILEDVFEALVGALESIDTRNCQPWEPSPLAYRFVFSVLESRVRWDSLVREIDDRRGINEKERLEVVRHGQGHEVVFRTEFLVVAELVRGVERVAIGCGRGDTQEIAREEAARRCNGIL